MNSDFLCLRIIYLFREPRSIVNVAPSRERVGAYRTTHLIPLGMAQAPGLGHAGRRRIGGQAVCRPRGVEHRQDVPRVRMHSNLGEKTSRGIRLCFSLQCYHSKFYSLCQAAISLLANKNFQNKNGSVTLGSNRRRRSRFVVDKCSNQPLFAPKTEAAGQHGKS